MPKWVRMIFGHQVNAIIMILHKKFQKNPHHHLGFMIKSLEEAATRNEFAAPVCSALCFNFIFQMPKWVRLIFGHQVNAIIMLLHKKIQKNPHHHLGFMIKYLEEAATGNEFAAPVSVHNCNAIELVFMKDWPYFSCLRGSPIQLVKTWVLD
jgi:uncharacterized protein YihD (DUF1040 family)